MQQAVVNTRPFSQPILSTIKAAESRLKQKRCNKMFFDRKTGHLWVYGNIESTNGMECFQTLKRLISQQLQTTPKLTLHLYNVDFNTSTVKYLMNFMSFLKRKSKTDLVWHFDQNDQLMKEIVYDFASLYNFNLKISHI
jgi:hypothetical protein